MKVELIFDPRCPNVNDTRRNLTLAFQKLELKPEWKEWNQQDAGAPDYVHKFGSPTVLINGNDLASKGCETNPNFCRLYENNLGNIQRFPTVEIIIKVMRSLS